jgi:hypothetical protein
MPAVDFKPLTHEEFNRLSLDERMAYLDQVMQNLRGEFEETRELARHVKEKAARVKPS